MFTPGSREIEEMKNGKVGTAGARIGLKQKGRPATLRGSA
jgi:hypothetical protein